MKFFLIAAAIVAMAVAGPTGYPKGFMPAGPAPITDLDGQPIQIGPGFVEDYSSIHIGPAIVDFPLSEGALAPSPPPSTPNLSSSMLVQVIVNMLQQSASPVSPVIVEEKPQETPSPVIVVEEPEVEPTPVVVVEEPEVEPTPVIVVEEPEVKPTPVTVVDEPEVEPTPVVVIEKPDHIDPGIVDFHPSTLNKSPLVQIIVNVQGQAKSNAPQEVDSSPVIVVDKPPRQDI